MYLANEEAQVVNPGVKVPFLSTLMVEAARFWGCWVCLRQLLRQQESRSEGLWGFSCGYCDGPLWLQDCNEWAALVAGLQVKELCMCFAFPLKYLVHW